MFFSFNLNGAFYQKKLHIQNQFTNQFFISIHHKTYPFPLGIPELGELEKAGESFITSKET